MFYLARLFLLLSLLFSLPCFAKTGYMNLMEAFESTRQGKKVKTRLERESKKAQSKLKTAENKLKQEEAGLQQEMALVSDQEKSKKIFKFQEKVSSFQREAKSKEVELQKLQGRLMDPILERLKLVTADTAKKEKYEVIKNMGPETLWVAPDLDITNQVVKAYNKKYK